MVALNPLSCEMAGAKDLLKKLPGLLGKEVRVIPAPCIGRCESAPAVVVGQNPVLGATPEAVARHVHGRLTKSFEPKYIDYAAYRKAGGYQLIADCLAGKHTREGITKVMEDSSLRGLGGAGFSPGRKCRLGGAGPARAQKTVDKPRGGTGHAQEAQTPLP